MHPTMISFFGFISQVHGVHLLVRSGYVYTAFRLYYSFTIADGAIVKLHGVTAPLNGISTA